ncbi:MAG: glutaredoxin domain-containing protein, partial [Mycobacterium sp.]
IGLRRKSIATTEIDIWSDSDAAERVRAVTGGDETVPTVFVGTQALVNPSVRTVVSAIEREFGDRAQEILGGAESVRRPRWSGLFRG